MTEMQRRDWPRPRPTWPLAAQLRSAEAQVALTKKNIESNLLAAQGGLSQAAAISGTSKASIEQAKADVVAARSRLDLALDRPN
ncbi:MAG: hypothetical protein U0165_17240 [Polyangiaceae bacterium]